MKIKLTAASAFTITQLPAITESPQIQFQYILKLIKRATKEFKKDVEIYYELLPQVHNTLINWGYTIKKDSLYGVERTIIDWREPNIQSNHKFPGHRMGIDCIDYNLHGYCTDCGKNKNSN